jgi:hypothetical protein
MNHERRASDTHTIIETPAYKLTAKFDRTTQGTSIKLISFIPEARRPEEQVKFQVTLTDEELVTLANIFATVARHHP